MSFCIRLSIAALLLTTPLSCIAQNQRDAKLDLKSVIKTTTLDDGMRVVVKPEPDSPLVACSVFVRVGSGQEDRKTAGIGSFVARTLLASTESKATVTMDNEIAELGGSVSVTRQPDWTKISALTVSDRIDETLDLLTDVIKNATFDPDAVETQRNQILSEIDNGDACLHRRRFGVGGAEAQRDAEDRQNETGQKHRKHRMARGTEAATLPA